VPPDAATLSVWVQVMDGTTMVFDGMTTVIVVDLLVVPLVPVTVIV
jgi:hypothetical protein